MSVENKVEYLKGLAEGLELDEKSSEGKLLVKIIDALEEFAATIEDNSDAIVESEERIDSLEDFADDFEADFDDSYEDEEF